MSSPITPEELARLLDAHAAALELFAAQWTRAPEDCVQEAFLQLVRQAARPPNLVAWLYRVVRNRAISQSRSSQRRLKYESARAADRPEWFEPQAGLGLDIAAVTEALAALPEGQREIVVARIWGGLSFEQIAEVVNVSRSTAHRRYTDGLNSLRDRLDRTWLTKHLT
jgi:RNA polymerase sigma-70 factor (ECF subfamily)